MFGGVVCSTDEYQARDLTDTLFICILCCTLQLHMYHSPNRHFGIQLQGHQHSAIKHCTDLLYFKERWWLCVLLLVGVDRAADLVLSWVISYFVTATCCGSE